jgi:hypothetical protein
MLSCICALLLVSAQPSIDPLKIDVTKMTASQALAIAKKDNSEFFLRAIFASSNEGFTYLDVVSEDWESRTIFNVHTIGSYRKLNEVTISCLEKMGYIVAKKQQEMSTGQAYRTMTYYQISW